MNYHCELQSSQSFIELDKVLQENKHEYKTYTAISKSNTYYRIYKDEQGNVKYEKTAMSGKDGTPNPNPYYEEKVEAVAEVVEDFSKEMTEEATEEIVAEEVTDEVAVVETEATTEMEEVAEETVVADNNEAVEPIMAITEYEYTDEVVIPDKEDTCECQELRCTISGLEAEVAELTTKCETYEKMIAENNEIAQQLFKNGVDEGRQSIEHDVVMLCECLYKLGFDVDLMYSGPITEEAPTEEQE